MLRDSSSPGNPKCDPGPPAALRHPLTEGPDRSDYCLGISRNCDSLRWTRTRLCRDPPYLALVEQRLLGLGGLDGQVRLPLLQQVLGHQRDPPLRPADGTSRSHPGNTPVTSRPPRAAPSPRMLADPAFPPSPLQAALTPPAPPSCRAGAAHARGEAGPRPLPLSPGGSPSAPFAFPGIESAGKRLAGGQGVGLPRGQPCTRARGQAVRQPRHPQVVPEHSVGWCWVCVPGRAEFSFSFTL